MVILTSIRWDFEWVNEFLAYKVTFLGLFIGLLLYVVLLIVKNKISIIKTNYLNCVISIVLVVLINSIVEYSSVLNTIITNGHITEVWIAPSWESSHAAILGGVVSIFMLGFELELEFKLPLIIKLGSLTILTILLLTFSSTFFVGFFLSNKEALRFWWLVSSLISGTTLWVNFCFFKKLK